MPSFQALPPYPSVGWEVGFCKVKFCVGLLCPMCAGGRSLQLFIRGEAAMAWDKLFGLLFLLLSSCKRHDSKESSCIVKLWGPGETDASCWKQPFKAKGTQHVGLPGKKYLLLAVDQLPVVVLASSPAWPTASPWHLAAGLKRGHCTGVSGMARWTRPLWMEEDLKAERIKKVLDMILWGPEETSRLSWLSVLLLSYSVYLWNMKK